MTTAMLVIGNEVGTIKAASEAIIAVLKAAGTEAASVAAMNALAELARAPQHTSISGCSFVTEQAPTKVKRKRP